MDYVKSYDRAKYGDYIIHNLSKGFSGESDPRNKGLMKMFNLINIGERAGSGVPDIFNTWEQEGWGEPIIEERKQAKLQKCLD